MKLTVVMLLLSSSIALAQGAPVVARIARPSETAAVPVPPTLIVSPSTNAMFRISGYMSALEITSSGSKVCAVIRYTDDSGKRAKTLVQISETVGFPVPTFGGGEIVIYAKASTPVTYSMTRCQGGSGFRYSAYIEVEQLTP